jgi:hypothetical protein
VKSDVALACAVANLNFPVGMESLKYRWRTRIDYAEQKSALARLQMSGLW